MFSGRNPRTKKGINAVPSSQPGAEGNSAARRVSHVEPIIETNDLPHHVVEVMTVVRLSWEFMTTAEFNPIPYSLSLLDGSSLGNDFASFSETYAQVEKAMDTVVNDYHLSFNQAIQKFSSVVETIAESQKRVKNIYSKLEQSKDSLECKRFDFLHLWVKSLQHKEMSRILDRIVELQGLVVNVDDLVQDRHFLHAVRILSSAEKLAKSPDLVEIEALSAIRTHFEKVKTQLHENLIIELQNHIYLKNKSSKNRIGKEMYDFSLIFSPNSTNLRVDLKIGSPTSDMLRFAKNTLLYDETDTEQAGIQIDSYGHIQLLLEGLFHLGTLQEALLFIKDRIGIDLYHVVDQVLFEIERKHPQEDQDSDQYEPIEDHELFSKLLDELFRQLNGVLDGHIFALAVSHELLDMPKEDTNDDDMRAISKESLMSSPNGDEPIIPKIYTMREVATAIQNEVKGLLYQYFTTTEDVRSNSAMPVLAFSDMLKDSKKGLKRQNQVLYHFKLTPQEHIKRKLQAVCPDFDENGIFDNAVGEATEYEAVGRQEKSIDGGHSQILKSEAANTLVAYKPTLEFMKLLEKKISCRLANFKMFLEDFLFNVYFPQLQEQILVYFHANVNGIDAFQTDMYPDTPYPLMKSALCMVLEVQGIYKTMESVQHHSEEVVKFILFTLKKYLEKCTGRFKSILSDDTQSEDQDEEQDSQQSTVISSIWALDPELRDIYSKNTYLNGQKINLEINKQLGSKETMVQLKLKGERSFHKSELLSDTRKIQQISSLIHGIDFVVQQVQLEMAANPLVKQSEGSSPWDSTIEEILEQFNELMKYALYTLRIEIRCRTLFYLELAIREGDYAGGSQELLNDEDQMADPYINLLNQDLIVIEEIVSESMPRRKGYFLFDGLNDFIQKVLKG